MCLQSQSEPEAHWTCPDVVILGADRKERGLRIREYTSRENDRNCLNHAHGQSFDHCELTKRIAVTEDDKELPRKVEIICSLCCKRQQNELGSAQSALFVREHLYFTDSSMDFSKVLYLCLERDGQAKIVA